LTEFGDGTFYEKSTLEKKWPKWASSPKNSLNFISIINKRHKIILVLSDIKCLDIYFSLDLTEFGDGTFYEKSYLEREKSDVFSLIDT